MFMPKLSVGLLALGLTAGLSQSAGPEFEVASVRPSPEMTPALAQSGRTQGVTMDGGRIVISGIPMAQLLSLAFGLPRNQIAGPDWMMSQRFDIQAKLPAGAAEGEVPEMLQALLADRFKLVVHRENKTQSVNALVVAKSGLKVKPAAPEGNDPAPAPADPNAPAKPAGMIMPLGGSMARVAEDSKSATVSNAQLGTLRASESPTGMHLEAPNATFEGLAGLLTELLRQPVVDLTGMKGRYQVVLDLSAPDMADGHVGGGEGQGGGAAAPDPRAQLITAALEKAGLKLESRKIPMETVVVDHLEKTPTDN